MSNLVCLHATFANTLMLLTLVNGVYHYENASFVVAAVTNLSL